MQAKGAGFEIMWQPWIVVVYMAGCRIHKVCNNSVNPFPSRLAIASFQG